jgi:hypothetical protein
VASLALDDGVIGSEFVGRIRNLTRLGLAAGERLNDETLELGPTAADKSVDHLGRVTRRQLGAPARQ